jgi:hypothetical protein
MPGSTTRGVPYPLRTDPIDADAATSPVDSLRSIADFVETSAVLYLEGTRASQPAAGVVGRVMRITDEGEFEWDTGAAWVPVAPPATRVAVKSADESVTSSTVLQDDDELFAAVEANTTYVVEAWILRSTTTDPEWAHGWTFPTGAALKMKAFAQTESASPSVAVYPYNWSAIENLTFTEAPMFFIGRLLVGATAGNLRFQFAQQTSHTTAVTVHAGSWLRLRKVS